MERLDTRLKLALLAALLSFVLSLFFFLSASKSELEDRLEVCQRNIALKEANEQTILSALEAQSREIQEREIKLKESQKKINYQAQKRTERYETHKERDDENSSAEKKLELLQAIFDEFFSREARQ